MSEREPWSHPPAETIDPDRLYWEVRYHAALSSGTALRLVLELHRYGPQPVGKLAQAVGTTPSGASAHLTRLRDLGIVTVTPNGGSRIYRLQPAAEERIARAWARVRGRA